MHMTCLIVLVKRCFRKCKLGFAGYSKSKECLQCHSGRNFSYSSYPLFCWRTCLASSTWEMKTVIPMYIVTHVVNVTLNHDAEYHEGQRAKKSVSSGRLHSRMCFGTGSNNLSLTFK